MKRRSALLLLILCLSAVYILAQTNVSSTGATLGGNNGFSGSNTFSGNNSSTGIFSFAATSGIASIKVDRMMAVGTAPTCAFTSGGGTSPSCTLQTGSTDTLGTIIATTGTGTPGSTGTITLTFSATFGTNNPSCIYELSNGGAGQWGALATTSDKTPSTSSDLFNWTNATGGTPAGVALSTSTAYWIIYHCWGK
jgi:hypothetical protein